MMFLISSVYIGQFYGAEFEKSSNDVLRNGGPEGEWRGNGHGHGLSVGLLVPSSAAPSGSQQCGFQ